MRNKFLLVLLIGILMIALTGCGGTTTTEAEKADDASGIVGTWKGEDEEQTQVYEFNEDGTYTSSIETTSPTSDEKVTSEATGTYEVKEDKDLLVLTEDSVSAAEGESTEETNDQVTAEYTYTIEDDQLTLEDANGYSMTFTKE